MTIKIRRLIYIIFILIFLIITPLIIFYTIGWRWNFYKNKPEKIGNLVIKTTPKQINIKINNHSETRNTPINYRYLLPNSYHIEISKPGYYSWDKNLIIKSGNTTFAKDIYLFKKNQTPKILIDNNVDFWKYNKKYNLIIWQNDNKLYTYSLFTKKSNIINDFSEKITQATWGYDNSSLLIKTEKNWYLWNTSNPLYLKKINKNKEESYKICHWEKDKNTIICLKKNLLIEIEQSFAQKNIITFKQANKILDFYKNKKNIYILEQNNDDFNVYLKIINQSKNNNHPIYLLPVGTDYKFIKIKDKAVTVLDKTHHNLYLFNLNDNQETFNHTSKTISDVKNAFYSDDNTLVYYNDWEVWVEKNNTEYLITRQSDKINQVLWHKSNNYLLMNSINCLKMIELDNRDKRNVAEIIKKNGNKKTVFTADGTNIIFSSDKQKGLFIISILPNHEGYF